MENLKKLRKEKGITQQLLAEKFGLSQQSIYKYENELAEPDIATLKSLAEFFGTSIDYLVGFTDSPSRYGEGITEDPHIQEAGYLQFYRQMSFDDKKIMYHLSQSLTDKHTGA